METNATSSGDNTRQRDFLHTIILTLFFEMKPAFHIKRIKGLRLKSKRSMHLLAGILFLVAGLMSINVAGQSGYFGQTMPPISE